MGKEARRWASALKKHDAYSERAAVAEEAQAANSAKAVACKCNSGAVSVLEHPFPTRTSIYAYVTANRLSAAQLLLRDLNARGI